MKGITEHWFAIGLEQRVVAVDAMCTVGPSNGVGLFVLWVSDSQLIDDAMECRPHKNGVGTLGPNLNRLSPLVPCGKGAYALQ